MPHHRRSRTLLSRRLTSVPSDDSAPSRWPARRSIIAYFVHQDHLSSTHLLTDVNGCVVDSLDYLPYGESYFYTPSCSASAISLKFTGKERDSESNLDNSQARYYSSQQGRFMSPDPAGIAAADPSDPQSWNQYAYVQNNPVNLTDPTGLDASGCNTPLGPGLCSTTFGFSDAWGDGMNGSAYPLKNLYCSGTSGGFGSGACITGQRTITIIPLPMPSQVKPSIRATRSTDNSTSCAKVGLSAITGAFSFKTKLGLEATVANFGVDATLYKDVSTEETGMQLSLNLGVFGGQISRTLSPGNSGADPTRAQFTASLGPVEHNFTTSQTDSRLSFGLALGLGGEISFDSTSSARWPRRLARTHINLRDPKE
jgi:RHS repeat-associated protein